MIEKAFKLGFAFGKGYSYSLKKKGMAMDDWVTLEDKEGVPYKVNLPGENPNKQLKSGKSDRKPESKKASRIENMSSSQINEEIKKTQKKIQDLQKKIDGNIRIDSDLQKSFPLGRGGSGWNASEKRQYSKNIESSVKKAKEAQMAIKEREGLEKRLTNLEKAKSETSKTGMTQSQAKQASEKKVLENAGKSLAWKVTQKQSRDVYGYKPRIIEAGRYKIQGSDGYYTVFEDGKRVGSVESLAKAKAIAEIKSKRSSN